MPLRTPICKQKIAAGDESARSFRKTRHCCVFSGGSRWPRYRKGGGRTVSGRPRCTEKWPTAIAPALTCTVFRTLLWPP